MTARPIVSVLCVAMTASSPALGSAPPVDAGELELESLLDLTVESAAQIEQPIAAAPATVSVLDRGQILDHGWLDLDQLLWSLPGMVESHDCERRLTSSRGSYDPWNHNRMLMLIDGVPLVDLESGAAWTWEVTPLYLARRVEVLRGPGSAIYGGQAVLGVISLDTIDPEDLGGKQLEARVTAGPRSQVVDLVAAADDGRTGGIVAGARAARLVGDGYLAPDASGRTAADGALLEFPNQEDRAAAALFGKWRGRGAADGLVIEALHQTYRTELGLGWTDWAADRPQHVTDTQTVVSARYGVDTPAVEVRSAVQLQRRGYSLDARLFPAGSPGYPDGVDEVLRTSIDRGFASGHVLAKLPRGAGLLVGAEYSATLYGGDSAHTVTADPASVEPVPYAGPVAAGDMYGMIEGEPVHAAAGFVQLSTGQLLGPRVEVTAGARADLLAFRRRDAGAMVSGSYHHLSPRLAAVARVSDALSVKAMAATAFRLPALIELFAQGSFTGTGNPTDLAAETERTYELAADWRATAAVRFRVNGFYAREDNLIDYAPTTLVLQNLYDNRRAGLEAEVQVATRVGGLGLDGWASYAYTRLLSESVHSASLSTEDRLTWVPAQVAKLGARVTAPRWGATLEVYGQGRTFRRATDLETVEFRAGRPASIAPWVDADLGAWYQATATTRLGLRVTHALDAHARVPVARDVPFDARTLPREVTFTLALEL